ncbi:MAG: Crp/Fnr family transcriptional regulator [Chitinophagales bacterium]|nr:Crp/Fnr family transcriptional regulator [Bacteroidota bacterium]
MNIKNWFITHESKNHFNRLVEEYCTEEWKSLIKHYQTTKLYKKGEYIIKEGDLVENIGIISTGKIKVFNTHSDKIERIIRFATDGQIVGHRGLGVEMTYSISAMALIDTEVKQIPIEIFKNVLKANNEFCYQVLLFFADELKRSENQIKYFTSLKVNQQVALALIMNYDAFGFDEEIENKLSFTISRKDISNLTGCTYESVVRVLSTFNKNGIIEIDNKDIFILDMKKLHKLLE